MTCIIAIFIRRHAVFLAECFGKIGNRGETDTVRYLCDGQIGGFAQHLPCSFHAHIVDMVGDRHQHLAAVQPGDIGSGKINLLRQRSQAAA